MGKRLTSVPKPSSRTKKIQACVLAASGACLATACKVAAVETRPELVAAAKKQSEANALALDYPRARLEVIVTDSVVEALALENNLIKQRSPRYNILLRDDKNYPYLQLTTNEAFPRVLVARRVERDGSFYAGPFLPARFARKTAG